MTTLAGHGLSVELPPGWEAAIYRRPSVAGETTHPVLHAGSFPLPLGRGDFGSGAVDAMTPGDALVVLLEYHADSTGTALFARRGMPRAVDPAVFSPATLQRSIPGQGGAQWFFQEAGRAFCLYVVLGSHRRRAPLVPAVTQVRGSVRIGTVRS